MNPTDMAKQEQMLYAMLGEDGYKATMGNPQAFAQAMQQMDQQNPGMFPQVSPQALQKAQMPPQMTPGAVMGGGLEAMLGSGRARMAGPQNDAYQKLMRNFK